MFYRFFVVFWLVAIAAGCSASSEAPDNGAQAGIQESSADRISEFSEQVQRNMQRRGERIRELNEDLDEINEDMEEVAAQSDPGDAEAVESMYSLVSRAVAVMEETSRLTQANARDLLRLARLQEAEAALYEERIAAHSDRSPDNYMLRTLITTQQSLSRNAELTRLTAATFEQLAGTQRGQLAEFRQQQASLEKLLD